MAWCNALKNQGDFRSIPTTGGWGERLKARGISAKAKWALGGVLALVLILVGGATAYAVHFSNVALPGVQVMGQSVTGQTQEEIAAAISQRAADTTVTVDVDGEEIVATLPDLGIRVDAEEMAAQAFEQNASVVSRFTALLDTKDVPLIYTEDPAVLEEFSNALAESVDAEPQNGGVELDDSGEVFVAVPGSQGAGLDTSDLNAAVVAATTSLSPQTVEVDVVQVDPAVTTEDAERVAAEANALVALSVSLNGNVSVNPADTAEKASWLVIPTSEDGLGTPSIDKEKVTLWVNQVADSTNDDPVKGVRNVDSEGNVLSVLSEGQKGYTVNNATTLVEELIAALESGQEYTGKFVYDEVEPEFDDRPIAVGSENLAYQAAPGEKWVDINLSNFTVTGYEGSTVVKAPVAMVHGMPGAETVTGTFDIYLKYQQQTMRGTRPDGSRYVTEDVPWVMYFHGGYALHGAYWRSVFGHAGPSGSNGCVNLPVEVAHWYYDWTDIGTKVVSHY